MVGLGPHGRIVLVGFLGKLTVGFVPGQGYCDVNIIKVNLGGAKLA
jgi:hypothetical protein